MSVSESESEDTPKKKRGRPASASVDASGFRSIVTKIRLEFRTDLTEFGDPLKSVFLKGCDASDNLYKLIVSEFWHNKVPAHMVEQIDIAQSVENTKRLDARRARVAAERARAEGNVFPSSLLSKVTEEEDDK